MEDSPLSLYLSGKSSDQMNTGMAAYIAKRQAESVLRECGITLNRNSLPADVNGPWYTSGLRIGTPAVTSPGMGKKEMEIIASIIQKVLSSARPDTIAKGKNAGKLSRAGCFIDKQIKGESIEDADSSGGLP